MEAEAQIEVETNFSPPHSRSLSPPTRTFLAQLSPAQMPDLQASPPRGNRRRLHQLVQSGRNCRCLPARRLPRRLPPRPRHRTLRAPSSEYPFRRRNLGRRSELRRSLRRCRASSHPHVHSLERPRRVERTSQPRNHFFRRSRRSHHRAARRRAVARACTEDPCERPDPPIKRLAELKFSSTPRLHPKPARHPQIDTSRNLKSSPND